MARYLVECTVDPAKLELLAALRAEHYEFLIARRAEIVFGGPARVREGGPPQAMVLVVDAPSLSHAQSFIDAEPYHRGGGFSAVSIRVWDQVVPELVAGSLRRTLDSERTDDRGSR